MAFGNNEEKKKKLKPAKTISTSLNAADKIVKKVDPSASKKSAFSQSNSPEKAVGRTRTSVSSWMKPKNRVSEKVWYKGSEPTETETLAQILKISETDNATAEQAYKFYEQAKAEGTWKETYDKATSPYLTALGIEDPSQINDEFFAANAHLYQQGVHTASGGLSTNKKNGPGAGLAANLNGLHEDYETTKKLQAEQEQIIQEAKYWMSKGLSDDEVKAKLNIGGEGSKYKNITSALEKAAKGEYEPTTAPIWAATSWGVDGMLWSLRNPEQSTGDYFHDAIQKDMGRGTPYAANPVAQAKRDKASPAWSPYENGPTMDETAITLGVNGAEGFLRDDSWWEQKRLEVLASGDPKAESAYADAWKAEQKTRAVEDELPSFLEDVELRMEAGLSPEEVFAATFEAYPEIKELYDGYVAISPVELTRGVGIDFGALRSQITANYELKQAQKNAPQDPAAMQTAVEAEKQAQIEANGSLINTDTVPKSLTAQNTSVFAQPPEKTFQQGLLWASARTMTDVLPLQVDYLQDVETKPQSAPYQLAGAYSEWTDDQKYAAQNYISDSRGGHDTSDAVQEMKDAGLTDEQVNTFRSQMTDALGSGDYTDELMDAWFEPVEAQPESYTYGEINAAIQSGDLPGALDMMEVNFDKKVAEDPELLNTENAAKASVAMLGLAAESGVLADPEQQEHAAAIADTVIASMNMAEDGGFYMWLDNVLNYNGTLIEAAQNNPGWGLNNTLMWAMDHTADTITDLADKFIGYAINGIGRAVGSEELAQKGEEIANEMTARVAGHSDLLMQTGTPLEILGGQALSETAKMATFGKASQFLNAGTAIAFGEKWKWLTKAISGSPFALESGVREFDEAYQETSGDYMTSLLSGMAGFASTAIMSRWDGILKNIEAQGSPFLREVVEKVGFFNGAGVKATVARWGKAGSMWLWNLAKTAVNEAVQEPAENVLTTFLTDAVKGENPLDRDWEAYGKELIADGAMAAIISLGSSVSTMAPYANSVKVVESQLGKPNLTGQDVQDFVTAITQDAQNPQLAEDATNRANAIAVEVRAGEIAAETGAQGADGSQLAAAQEKVEAAGEKVAETDAAVKQANQEMQTANERLNENPGDQQAAAAFTAAVQKKLSADQAGQKAQNVLLKAISDRDAAQEAAQAESQVAMDAIRTQAAAEVEQAYAGLEKQKAETQRQGGSVDPDSFIQPTPDHTPEQKAEIQAYHNATNSKMLEAAEMYKDNPGAKNKRVLLSEVGEREGADIQQILGLNVEGYTHTADRSFFTHVEKRHGEHGEADQSMRSLNDVARVGWVLENYDSVERVYNSDGSPATADGYLDKDGKHMPLLKYIKKLDGTVYVVEAAGDNNWKRLWLVSAYMQKNSPVNNSQSATVTQTPYAEDQPLGNVRNANASPVTSIIAGSEQIVNGNLGQPNTDTSGDAASSAPQAPTSAAPESSKQGQRQFVEQTMPNTEAVPEWIWREFQSNPDELNYDIDTNREQVERSWQRIQQNGYEQERDRLLSLERYSADDTAEANLMMAMALREETSDPATFMALASHYNKEGTKAGQELQARKLFTRMSPTGARVWAAGKMETALEEHMRAHRPQKQKVDRQATYVADTIRNLTAGEDNGEINGRWGVPVNEQQQALIDHYKLNNVARPGLFYNRATTKQRMLEAILATPNPLEATGLGLNLVQRLEYLNAGEAVITNADLDYIGTQMAEFVARGGESGGRDADLAVARAYEAYGNIAPAAAGQKARTWRYVAMLTSFTSAERNVIGNAAQNIANAATHGLAVEIDRAISKKTGQRTVEHLSMQERAQGWRAFADETKNTFLDYFVDKTTTQKGNAKYDTNQRGRVYQTQAIEAIRNVEGFLMSFGDRNFWKKAYINSLAEQQKLADRGLLYNADGTTRTYEQMVEQAEQDANYATFTEDNRVSEVLTQLKDVPVLGLIVDFIMPFTGVPSNITRRMIEYSPVSLVKGAYRYAMWKQSGKNFDQQAFVNDIARGLTGTAMFGVGALLANMGVIKIGTGEEEDKKKYGLQTAMGQQYTPYIYNPLTDEYVSLAVFSPAASALTMGASAWSEFKDDKTVMQSLMNAAFGSIDQIFDASYMSGLNDLFGGYGGSFGENLRDTLLDNMISQSVPAILGQLASALDPYVRDTKDKNSIMQSIKSGIINKIPFLRQAMLPMKVDVTGQPVRTKEGWRNFVDPFTTTDAREDPVVDELFRLNEAIGASNMFPSDALSGTKDTLTINGKKVVVDDAGKEAYKLRYGELWMDGGKTLDKKGKETRIDGVRFLMKTSRYQRMTDEEKAKAIADILSAAKTGASMEAFQKYGETTEKE